jgi:DNA-binding PadR family transcriptional regulator
MPLTPSDHVVLGMISLGANTGYAIKQTVERSIRFFWTISQAQIYPSLQRLEELGLIRGRDAPRGRRPRREFELTEAGRTALVEWMRADEEIPFELRDTGMLKLFFADALAPDDAAALLERVRERSEGRLRALRAIEQEAERAAQEGNLHPLLTLELGLSFTQAMVDVCDSFAGRLAPGAR